MNAFLSTPAGGPALLGFMVVASLLWVWARKRDLRLREERRRNGVTGRPPGQFLAFVVIGVAIVIIETLSVVFSPHTDGSSLIVPAVLLIVGVAFVVVGLVGYSRKKKSSRRDAK
ncbi:hypothetical protein B7R21_18605 [Subtercola boreus]|uniref:Uncharacterized protein n=1 Tax=Subtercola boreus TaxID=120213 RepID=A0A3E0VAX6_9MICO|nr:hypothetical protein [Subtercola boreus]RFA06785.1 hypothetical protein B7R21_18605 [Subtercola boreus]